MGTCACEYNIKNDRIYRSDRFVGIEKKNSMLHGDMNDLAICYYKFTKYLITEIYRNVSKSILLNFTRIYVQVD